MSRVREFSVIFVNAILAGIFIGMAGTVFLSVENRVIGAFLFGFGLLTIVCYGYMINDVLKAVRVLAEKGISAEVIKLNKITYAKFPTTFASLEKTARLLMPEEVCAIGCVGRHLLAQASEAGIHLKAARFLNLGDNIVPHGTRALLLRDFGADAEAMVRAAEGMCLA